jgi:hypothetical protein
MSPRELPSGQSIVGIISIAADCSLDRGTFIQVCLPVLIAQQCSCLNYLDRLGVLKAGVE